jgi:hypothetical protein
LENLLNRLPNYLDVKPKTPMIDVPDVESESLFPTESIPAIHLGPTSDSRFDFVAASLFWAVPRQVIHQEGPRANETHVASQDIPELRQFV